MRLSALRLALSLTLALAGAFGRAEPALASQAPQPLEFRGLAFGSSAKDVPDLVTVAGSGPVRICRRQGQPSRLGDMASAETTYYYYDDMLHAVRLTIAGGADFGELRAAYAAKYGQPRLATRGGAAEVLVWTWPLVEIEMRLDRREGAAVVDYVYLPRLAPSEKPLYQDDADLRRRGPIGFRGVRFGENVSRLPDMRFVYGSGGSDFYRREGDRLFLGEIGLSDIFYCFYKDALYHVVMKVGHYADFAPLLAAYAKKYGPPASQVTALGESHLWRFETAQIALERNSIDGTVEISYAHLPVLAAMERETADIEHGDAVFLRKSRARYAAGPPPAGFRGLAWGADIRDMPDMDFLYVHKNVRHFRRKSDVRSLGDIPLTDIVYSYHGGKLYQVTMEVASKSREDNETFHARLAEAYSAKYGPAKVKESSSSVHYLWNWPAVNIALVKDKATSAVEIGYVYTPVLDALEKDKVKAALDDLYSRLHGQRQKAGGLLEKD